MADETCFHYAVPSIPAWKLPSARGGASMVTADEKLVIFGGHFLSGGSEEKGGEESRFAYLNEVWVFDIRREEWHKMDCAGEKKNIPQPRYGHSALLFGARMFIFGGKGEKNQLFNDIFFLDLVEWRWESVTSLSKPPVPRLFHAFEQVGRKMVIHGGWDGNSSFSDLHIFDTDSFTWTSPSTTGFVPSSRYGLVLFGGCAVSSETSVPKYLNDARQLDTNSMSWSLLSAEGSPPSGRCGHSASLQSDGRSIVFYGGWGKRGCQTEAHTADPKAKTLHVLQLVKLQWSSPPCGERKPPKHTYYHSACVSGDSVIVFGGFDGRQASNMVISLRVEGTERVTMENGPASSIATPALNDE